MAATASENPRLRNTDIGWPLEERQAHKGYDETPEDHLWRAATAFVDIDDALRTLG